MCLLNAAYGIPAVSSEEEEEEEVEVEEGWEEIVVESVTEGSPAIQLDIEIDPNIEIISTLGEDEEVEDVSAGERAWEASSTLRLSLGFRLASLAGLLVCLGLMVYMLVQYALQMLDDGRLANSLPRQTSSIAFNSLGADLRLVAHLVWLMIYLNAALCCLYMLKNVIIPATIDALLNTSRGLFDIA